MPEQVSKLPWLFRNTTAFLRPWSWRNPSLWLGLLVLALLSYSWMFSGISVPNERSRVYLTVAMIDHGTLSIDEPIQRFGRINDWARRGDHHYTDKAPGSSLLGAIPYSIVRCFSQPDDWKVHELINLMRSFVMIPIGILGFFWMRRLLLRLESKSWVSDITALGWLLGTSAFHYSTAFYGHQIVAVCLLGALDLVLVAELRLKEGTEKSRDITLPMVGAGMLAGLAGLTEYQAGIPAAFLTLYVLAGPLRKRIPSLASFFLGALPFALLLFTYNTLAFGGPLELSYHHLIDPSLRELHGQGIGGVALPQTEYAIGGLLSLHRGLFTTSPMLLFALPGLILMARHRPRLTILVGGTLLYFLLFISSTKIWYAGWSFGPRLVVPVLAWAMIPVGVCLSTLGQWALIDGIARGSILFGIAYHQAVHAVFPELPEDATHPIADVVIPALRSNQVSPNVVNKYLGWQAPNSLIPLMVLLGLLMVWLLWAGKERSRKACALRFSGVLISLTLCSLPLFLSDRGWSEQQSQRFLTWMGQLSKTEENFVQKAKKVPPN